MCAELCKLSARYACHRSPSNPLQVCVLHPHTLKGMHTGLLTGEWKTWDCMISPAAEHILWLSS